MTKLKHKHYIASLDRIALVLRVIAKKEYSATTLRETINSLSDEISEHTAELKSLRKREKVL